MKESHLQLMHLCQTSYDASNIWFIVWRALPWKCFGLVRMKLVGDAFRYTHHAPKESILILSINWSICLMLLQNLYLYVYA